MIEGDYIEFGVYQGNSFTGVDKETKDFRPGQYKFQEEQFLERIERKGVDLDRVVTIPGWFDQTCCSETKEQHQIKAASVVWVDGDLYESAVPALDFVTPLLQDGTVVIFDDWFAFRGNPRRGEQRAFYEWMDRLEGFSATEYQREGVWRNSFIMNRKKEGLFVRGATTGGGDTFSCGQFTQFE